MELAIGNAPSVLGPRYRGGSSFARSAIFANDKFREWIRNA